ncbi:MAG: RNA polymerase subunit sigma-70 [Eubacterium sp.]|nr:RNA polymerase subunit sigma-70 [Eubacterium sp.]
MNTNELAELISRSNNGDSDAYIQLYSAVYRPLYKIARFALKSEEAAIAALQQTVKDSFAAIAGADISGTGSFIEWIVKILCTKIKLQYKTGRDDKTSEQQGEFTVRSGLDSLPNIDRLVLAVSVICGCPAEKTAKLCGYTVNTVEVCLTNAEVVLKTGFLAQV